MRISDRDHDRILRTIEEELNRYLVMKDVKFRFGKSKESGTAVWILKNRKKVGEIQIMLLDWGH